MSPPISKEQKTPSTPSGDMKREDFSEVITRAHESEGQGKRSQSVNPMTDNRQ